MTPDRIDDLLARTLESGAIPDDATAAERAELEVLRAGADELRLNSTLVDAEARASMPAARARFQRHLAEQRSPAAVPARAPAAPPRRSWFGGGRFGGALAFAAPAAALGVIALVAILVLQPFGGVETASALTPDDYIQVQGVVSETSGQTVSIRSELGDLQVTLSEITSVIDSNGAADPSGLKTGDSVAVGGVVQADRRTISARTVAISQQQATATPVIARAQELKKFREGVQGNVSLISISPDGARARVVIVSGREHLIVAVDAASVNAILRDSATALGVRVRVVSNPALSEGVFSLQLLDGAGEPTTPGTPATGDPNTPRFAGVQGVIVGRIANVVQVQTARGRIAVVLRLDTLIYATPDSGLTRESLRDGETAVGHGVTISGGLEREGSNRVIADVVFVGPRIERSGQ